jgi:hypothetical protein
MKKYTITLKHDKGTVKISTVSTSMEQAIKTVLDWENAPFNSVKKVTSKNI